jgi:hypothetical protein
MGQGRILAVAAICLLGAGLFGYARYAVLDEGAFAERAASTLASDEVRVEIADRMASRATFERPELAGSEAMLEDVVADRVATAPAFRSAFSHGAASLHRALVSAPDAEASLLVEGSSAAMRAEVLTHLGLRVPAIEDVPLLSVGQGGPERTLRRLAPAARDLAAPLAIGLGLAGLALLALAFAREPDRRRAAWGTGLAVAAAAGLAAAGVTAARDVALDRFDTGFGDAVVGTIWDAYLGDLRTWALAACAAGLVAAAVAGGPRPAVSSLLAAPASRGGRALRAALLLGVAALAVQLPELVLHTGLIALAAGVFYVAAGDLLRLLPPPTVRRAPLPAAASAPARSSTARPRSSSRPRRTW